jgi:hypothetical protein
MYPFDISGITEKPGGKFIFNNDVNEQTIRQLVEKIPIQITVSFYDKSYPSPSDPGAYVLFKRDENQYVMQRANHGWSSKWEKTSIEGLVNYLLKCQNFNMGVGSMDEMFYFQSPPPRQKKWWEFWK